MGYGGMSSAMALKMGGKKKPGLMDDTSGTTGGDTGDDSVDPSGAEEADAMDSSSKPVNSSPEEEAGIGNVPDEGEGPEMGSYDAVEDDAASELAGLVGVLEDKREAFKAALSDYVAACVKKQGNGK